MHACICVCVCVCVFVVLLIIHIKKKTCIEILVFFILKLFFSRSYTEISF